MKALTLIEPWGTLWARRLKINETRSWATPKTGPQKKPFRGWLFIHASHTVTNESRELQKICADRGIDLRGMQRGAIIGVVKIVDCRHTASFEMSGVHDPTLSFDLPSQELEFGDYSPGRYAWIGEDHREIKPVKCKGFQGLWNVDDRLTESILKQIEPKAEHFRCQFCARKTPNTFWTDDRCPCCGREYDAILAQDSDTE